MSISTWYHSQFSAWNRARQETTPRATMAATTPTTPVNATMINLVPPAPAPAPAPIAEKGKKHPDSLFGPNIGIVSSGPAWTTNKEKKVLADELTPDVVRGWIEKSKVASEPTTTLQALVNLKRPTLRLSPLSSGEDSVPDNHHHGLEFEFDCDAPKCGIYVHVLLDANHPDAPAATSPNGLSKLLVFETVVEGGFGKVLKLEEGATLELGRFVHREDATETPGASPSIQPAATSRAPDEAEQSSDSVPTTTALTPPTETTNTGNRQSRLRFSHFHFRKRTHNHSVSGPALAVVDAEPSTNHDGDANGAKEEKKEDTDDGVKVIIRLAALDEQGTELASPNEQLTYLHVVRFGAKPSAEEEEDTRPWVVKVVKREATIGPHTFHLHEIYGLSSSSTATHAPTAPLPESHTYPPDATTAPPPQPVAEDEPSSECLLCLSSPREVILLPCRHLVACKDCALNMVEFGAGGTITQPEEPAPAPATGTEEGAATTEGATTAEGTTTPAPAPAPTPTPTVIVHPRRKRKAKGWFCPVCRQPYTSLLRITNSPPEPVSTTAKEQSADDSDDVAESMATASVSTSRPSGLLSGAFRPAFLRSFSRNPTGDVESQTQMTRVGA